MKADSKNKNTKREDPIMETVADNQANAAEWLGAIVRYLGGFGRAEFGNIYRKEERTKNAIIGTLATLIIIVLLLYLAFKYIPV